MSAKSNAIGFARLHRIHAAAQATRVEFNSLNMTWRGEGGEPALKAAIAYRLSLCWNLLEGIPSAKLEIGTVRDVFEAVRAGDLERAQRLVAEGDDAADTNNGRLHDCAACLEREAGDGDAHEADEPEAA